MRPDLAVRVVDINRPEVRGIDWDSPVAKQYHIGSVPAFRVYGPNRKLIAEGRSAFQQVLTTMHDDME